MLIPARRLLLLLIWLALPVGCGSTRAYDPAADSGMKPAQKPPGTDGGLDCPKVAPVDGTPCDDDGQECLFVLVHCPGNPMGPEYEYENSIYRCTSGTWSYEGQDCYDCCRWPFDAGVGSTDAGCVPPAPSPGCDYCGKLVCPTGSSIDSACKCLVEGEGYVAPLSQSCDFCCGKVCPAGQFLDHACACYAP